MDPVSDFWKCPIFWLMAQIYQSPKSELILLPFFPSLLFFYIVAGLQVPDATGLQVQVAAGLQVPDHHESKWPKVVLGSKLFY